MTTLSSAAALIVLGVAVPAAVAEADEPAADRLAVLIEEELQQELHMGAGPSHQEPSGDDVVAGPTDEPPETGTDEEDSPHSGDDVASPATDDGTENPPVLVDSAPVLGYEGPEALVVGTMAGFDPLAGVTATDVEDGDLSDLVVVTALIDPDAPAVTVFSYEVTDSGGATATARRTVMAEDRAAQSGAEEKLGEGEAASETGPTPPEKSSRDVPVVRPAEHPSSDPESVSAPTRTRTAAGPLRAEVTAAAPSSDAGSSPAPAPLRSLPSESATEELPAEDEPAAADETPAALSVSLELLLVAAVAMGGMVLSGLRT